MSLPSRSLSLFQRIKPYPLIWRSYGKLSENWQPKRALILTKLSRLEFEKLRHPGISDDDLEKKLRHRGSDYSTLLYHHYIHKGCENRVDKCFREIGVETKVINRFEYNDDNINWADVIVTTGGDGTFLMAACRITDRNKPVIGFNTDPTRSEGYLCLPKKYSIAIGEAVKKIYEGKFKWTFRKRIRITLKGNSAFQVPVELHDQQLHHPENRFFECFREPLKRRTEDLHRLQTRVLPALALNEVYIGECVSARVSYFEMAVDGREPVKTKNAGLCVCTGTGSTSWAYNISKISPQTVEEILRILQEEEGIPELPAAKMLLDRVTKSYNSRLAFHPERKEMLYTLRDLISSYTLPYAVEIPSRAFASRLEVRSRCFDACLVIDGGLTFTFNDGAVAVFEMHDADALRTIIDVNDSDD